MMKKHLGAALTLTLMLCGTATAATIPVNQLSGQFAATNTSVVSTNDGVHFGIYANAGAAGGSLLYSGANGLTLSDITRLAFTETHNTSDDNAFAAPYLRIFLEGDAHDVIFDATQCANPAATPPENTTNHFEVVGADVRYDDDGCDGVPPDQQPWADVVAAHGTEVISGIYVSAGFTAGADLSALVTDLTVNGDTFCFNCAAATPAPIVNNTTFVTEPPRVNTAASLAGQSCKGNTLRRLHAPKRPGQRFVSVRATLRGKVLKVNGRTITANLTGQPEANYNVRLTIRYRARSGKIVTVKTTRNLSVVCA